MAQETWETQEVWNWLSNDESAYDDVSRLLRPYDFEQEEDVEEAAQALRMWVERGNAPVGLYESFKQPPISTFSDVDWVDIVQSWSAE